MYKDGQYDDCVMDVIGLYKMINTLRGMDAKTAAGNMAEVLIFAWTKEDSINTPYDNSNHSEQWICGFRMLEMWDIG